MVTTTPLGTTNLASLLVKCESSDKTAKDDPFPPVRSRFLHFESKSDTTYGTSADGVSIEHAHIQTNHKSRARTN